LPAELHNEPSARTHVRTHERTTNRPTDRHDPISIGFATDYQAVRLVVL